MAEIKNIILVGGGGHCKACIDVIEAEDRFKIAGIVDMKKKLHQKVLGYKIIAHDEDLPELTKDYMYFLITIGQIKSADRRKDKFAYLKNLEVKFPTIISPLAYVSKNAFISEGTIVMHKAFINANSHIGKNCIINTGAIIEHDTCIDSHCHISTGSIVNGECYVEEGTFIGSKSVISNKISIAKKSIIGAGSTVTKTIRRSGVYAGSPARKISHAK